MSGAKPRNGNAGAMKWTPLEPAASWEIAALIRELQAEPFTEKDAGIPESYLVKMRRDGVANHADTKQRLDALAENNTAIVALIKAYGPHAKTRTLKSVSAARVWCFPQWVLDPLFAAERPREWRRQALH